MAEIIEKFLKLPKQMKIGILALVIILIGASYYFFFDKPSREILNAKRNELAKLQSQYEEQRKALAELPRFQKEIDELQKQLDTAIKLLPNTREIPSLLSSISSLAEESGLRILLFLPKPEIPKDFYAEIPVDMKIFGKYHQLGTFFDKVSKLSRIVNFRDVVIVSKPQRRRGDMSPDSSIEASFSVITFKYVEEDEKPKKPERRRRRR